MPDLIHYDRFSNSATLEAHLLDAHRMGVWMVPREHRSLHELRLMHRQAHDEATYRFPHTHHAADLPVPPKPERRTESRYIEVAMTPSVAGAFDEAITGHDDCVLLAVEKAICNRILGVPTDSDVLQVTLAGE